MFQTITRLPLWVYYHKKVRCKEKTVIVMGQKLTKTLIDNTPCPAGGQTFLWDGELKGFGVRLTSTKKTYIVQARVNGRSVRKTIAGKAVFTVEEARKEAKAYLGDMSRGIDLNKREKTHNNQKVTLAQAYADYVRVRNLAAGTVKDYDRALRTTFADVKDKPLVSLNRDAIERIFKDASARGPAIANLDFRFLRAIFNFAMEKYSTDGEPLVPSNPCNRLTALKLWNKIDRRTNYITPQQLPAFFSKVVPHLPNDTDYIKMVRNHLAFIIFTGARDQESAQLRVGDMDFQKRTIIFMKTKNHKKHQLPTGDWLTEFMRKLCAGKKPMDYIFSANTKEGHLKYTSKAVHEIAAAAGLKFSLHDLRRTFATIADSIGDGFSNYTTKKLLNHSNGGDVTGGYVQVPVERLREPMQKIEDYILKNAGVTR
jgi:integrase